MIEVANCVDGLNEPSSFIEALALSKLDFMAGRSINVIPQLRRAAVRASSGIGMLHRSVGQTRRYREFGCSLEVVGRYAGRES